MLAGGTMHDRVHMAMLPYARPNGLANIFTAARLACRFWAVAVLAAVAWCRLGSRGFDRFGALLAITLALSATSIARSAGATGDTFGAVCEIIEIVPAFVAGPSGKSLAIQAKIAGG